MDSTVGRRKEHRRYLGIPGRIRTGSGTPLQVMISDFSEHGCSFSSQSPWFSRNLWVTISLGGIGPIAAQVRWVNDRQVGLEFKRALYGPVFERMIAQHRANKW